MLVMTQHERSGSGLESEQAQHEKEERFFDAVGRPRKLAAGAMSAMQREFQKGIPSRELAERYGVSVSLVLTICYHTPKGKPQVRPEPEQKRQVVIPADARELFEDAVADIVEETQ
jgi:hypothetical protein